MSDDALWKDGQSIFRPSYSATWLFCEGALIPSINAQDTAGEDAAIGTVFHWLMAEWQTNGRPDDWLDYRYLVAKEDGSENFEVIVDEEMFVMGEECLARVEHLQGDRYVETRVDISDITPIPDQGGTADLAICCPGILDITDWKYGKGVQVFALKNTQLLLYGWGFFKEYDWIYDFQTIRLRIAQPRLGHWDLWEITREELLDFAEWAKGRALAAWQPRAPRLASPKACQWCKVRLDCAALEAARQQLADLSFEALDEPVTYKRQQEIALAEPPKLSLERPATLPTAQLARIYAYRRLMERWFGEIGEELVTRGLQGDNLGDLWKVVDGRSRRKWKDEEAAARRLEKLGLCDDELHVRKLVSPNQAEKLLRLVGIRGKLTKLFLDLFVDRPVGRPTLVAIGDNRSEVPNVIDDTFDADDDDPAAI